MDADIVGISEADAMSGPNSDALLALITMMNSLGYSAQYKEKKDGSCAICIFYKDKKINLL